jgi:hypothetical protein
MSTLGSRDIASFLSMGMLLPLLWCFQLAILCSFHGFDPSGVEGCSKATLGYIGEGITNALYVPSLTIYLVAWADHSVLKPHVQRPFERTA